METVLLEGAVDRMKPFLFGVVLGLLLLGIALGLLLVGELVRDEQGVGTFYDLPPRPRSDERNSAPAKALNAELDSLDAQPAKGGADGE